LLGEPDWSAGAIVDALPGRGGRFIAVMSLAFSLVAFWEVVKLVGISTVSCSSFAMNATRAGWVCDAELTWVEKKSIAVLTEFERLLILRKAVLFACDTVDQAVAKGS
jgi:hypothetical protein